MARPPPEAEVKDAGADLLALRHRGEVFELHVDVRVSPAEGADGRRDLSQARHAEADREPACVAGPEPARVVGEPVGRAQDEPGVVDQGSTRGRARCALP